MSSFITNINVSEGSRTTRVILSSTAPRLAATDNIPGVFKFQLPPILDNTNDTHFSQCFISLRKVFIDPFSSDSIVNGVSMRNPNPVWVNAETLTGERMPAVGQVIMEMSVPSKQVGSIKNPQNGLGTLTDPVVNYYKWQELIGLTRYKKNNFAGVNDSLNLVLPNAATDIGRFSIDLGSRSTNSTTAGQNWGNQTKDGTGFNVLRNAANPDVTTQTIDGEADGTVDGAITWANGGVANISKPPELGNDFYLGYECKVDNPVLSGVPFGGEIEVRFKDPYGPARHTTKAIYLSDFAKIQAAAGPPPDISQVSIELIVTMVGNKKKT